MRIPNINGAVSPVRNSMTLTKFKQQRAGRRTQVTNLTEKVNSEVRKATPEKSILTNYVKELHRQKTLLIDLDDKILDITEESKIEEEIVNTSNYYLTIDPVFEKAQTCLESLNLVNNVPSTIEQTTRHLDSVKLPNIQLTKFSGNPLEWTTFWDLFRTTIHDRMDIAAPAKFQYLLSQLYGEAANLLSGFDPTANSYHQAIELLQKTYGKNKLLIQARLNALFELETPDQTATSLSNYRSSYEGHLRALSSLGPDINGAGFVFAELLMRKLPVSTRDNINRANKKEESWNLDDLREAINDEINHLTSLEQSKKGSSSLDNLNNDYSDNRKHNSLEYNAKTASFPITTNKNRCSFCHVNNHSTNSCRKYADKESRIRRIKELKLCFNCLKANHSVNSCTNQARCRRCGRKHHTSICDGNASPATRSEESSHKTQVGGKARAESAQTVGENKSSSLTVHSILDSKGTSNILPTAILSIINKDKQLNCKALFDLGSQKTFVHSNIVKYCNLEFKGDTTLCVDGFESSGTIKAYKTVILPIKCENDIIRVEAIVIDKMPSRLYMPGRKNIVELLSNKGLKLADNSHSDDYSDLSIIIGVDSYFKFMNNHESIEDIYLLDSKVGKLFAGTIPYKHALCNSVTVLKVSSSDAACLDLELKRMWELEHIGISPPKDECIAVKKFRNEISFKDGHYIAPLPWKDDHPYLPSNKNMALKRLDSLINKLKKNPTDLKCYDDIIKDQISRNFIEEVDRNEETSGGSKVHYIPHHAIYTKSTTTPLRIVYDCSAKASKYSPSLNNCLLTGPSLLNDLCSILLRIRINKYAISSDIEKAFLMIGLSEQDRDSCRFFWPADPFDSESEIKIYRFKVVLFGSTASQFLLNMTISYHLSQLNTQTSKDIARNLYVDNVQNSFATEESAISFFKNANTIMESGGFHLREWKSNSREINKVINGNVEIPKSQTSLLGFNWDMTEDNIYVKPFIDESKITNVTKRVIVQQVARIFDPLGYYLPIIVKGKILIQDLWKLDVS